MILATTIEIYAGGPGSGCTGPDCGRPSGKFSPATTRMAVKRYQDMSSGLNPRLRQGDLNQITQEQTEKLDQAFLDHGKTIKNKVLYRGVDWTTFPSGIGFGVGFQDKLTDYLKGLVGQEYTDGAFMSTSKSERGAAEWGNVVLRINTGEKGITGIDVEKLTGQNAFKDDPKILESEVLLPRDSKFKITGFDSKVKDGKTRFYLDMEPA